MITFHTSSSGGEDYLDFHTSDGARFYLGRDEARTLARAMLAATLEDVVCVACNRRNGVHAIDCSATSVVTVKSATLAEVSLVDGKLELGLTNVETGEVPRV